MSTSVPQAVGETRRVPARRQVLPGSRPGRWFLAEGNERTGDILRPILT